jgi:hypothetical protein
MQAHIIYLSRQAVCVDAIDLICCIFFYTQPLMEESWKGSNECVFSLANASDNVAGTQRLCGEEVRWDVFLQFAEEMARRVGKSFDMGAKTCTGKKSKPTSIKSPPIAGRSHRNKSRRCAASNKMPACEEQTVRSTAHGWQLQYQ